MPSNHTGCLSVGTVPQPVRLRVAVVYLGYLYTLEGDNREDT